MLLHPPEQEGKPARCPSTLASPEFTVVLKTDQLHGEP